MSAVKIFSNHQGCHSGIGFLMPAQAYEHMAKMA